MTHDEIVEAVLDETQAPEWVLGRGGTFPATDECPLTDALVSLFEAERAWADNDWDADEEDFVSFDARSRKLREAANERREAVRALLERGKN